MLSNKIYRHFFAELSKYFFIVLFTFSAIVWAVQAVNYLDLIVDDGHAVSVYLGYSALNISKIFTKFIPLSFLLALFLTILKFEDESEFMILWTAGLNKIRVVNFFLNVSLLVTLLQITLASLVNPEILNHSRSLIRSSNIDFISSMIKTNQFNDTVEGLTIYVQEKDENDLMKNIFIRDENKVLKGLESSKESGGGLTIFAERGRIEKRDRNYLLLENGTIQTENKEKEIQSVNFKKTSLLLQGMKTKSIVQPKLQETSSMILFACLFEKNQEKKLLNCAENSKIDALSEFNRRLGMPLYIPYIALLCSFLLISRNENKRKSLYKYFYFALAFITLVMAEILVRYSGKSLTYSVVYYLIPIISVPILYLILFRKLYFENLKR